MIRTFQRITVIGCKRFKFYRCWISHWSFISELNLIFICICRNYVRKWRQWALIIRESVWCSYQQEYGWYRGIYSSQSKDSLTGTFCFPGKEFNLQNQYCRQTCDMQERARLKEIMLRKGKCMLPLLSTVLSGQYHRLACGMHGN